MVLAHGPVLETPAFAVVVDQLGCFAGEEQGFLIVLLARVEVGVGVMSLTSDTGQRPHIVAPSIKHLYVKRPPGLSLFDYLKHR